jgi:hypothetical protein
VVRYIFVMEMSKLKINSKTRKTVARCFAIVALLATVVSIFASVII